MMFGFFKRKQALGIGAIFKNECDYILEWVAWHISQGIDKLIVYDNNSTDGSQQLLTKLAKLGIIDFDTITEQQSAQIPAYESILNDYKQKLDISAFVDADEQHFSRFEQHYRRLSQQLEQMAS